MPTRRGRALSSHFGHCPGFGSGGSGIGGSAGSFGGTSGGFLSFAGLDKVRAGDRTYFEIPFLGPYVLPQIEILLMRALGDPDGIVEDEERDRTLRLLLQMGRDPIPTMTNEAGPKRSI